MKHGLKTLVLRKTKVIIKTRAIIIKEEVVKESDKRLVVLTKNLGKILIYARGAKNIKSKFIVMTQFSYVDLILRKGSGFYSLNEVSLIESFYNLRLDYDRLETAYFITNIINQNIIGEMDEHESSSFLFLLLQSLNFLNKGISNVLVKSVFILKFLSLNGEEPTIEKNKIITEYEEIELPSNILEAVSYILKSDTKKAFTFKITNLEILESYCVKLLRAYV